VKRREERKRGRKVKVKTERQKSLREGNLNNELLRNYNWAQTRSGPSERAKSTKRTMDPESNNDPEADNDSESNSDPEADNGTNDDHTQ
jgi:hypothetical protein